MDAAQFTVLVDLGQSATLVVVFALGFIAAELFL